MLAAAASKCKAKLHCSTLVRLYSYPIRVRGFTSLYRSRSYNLVSRVGYIPVRVMWIWPLFAVLSKSIDQQLFATEASPSVDMNDEIFNQILSAPKDPLKSREEIFASYVNKFCSAGNILGAARFIRYLRDKDIFISAHAYDYLMEAASEKNDIDLLCQTFKDLLLTCKAIHLNSYLILARALAKHNDSVTLVKFIGEVSEMLFPRNAIVLNRIIFAFGECGHVDEALLIFNHMKNFNCDPDLVTYNTILGILGQLGRIDDMLQKFATMEKAGLVPDIISYNTLLNSLRKVGRLDLCLMYFKQMREREIEPDLRTYKALIESFGRSGNIEEALRIFDHMKGRQIRPSTQIYRALIFSLKRMGKNELAVKLSKEMVRNSPDFVGSRDSKWRK